MKILHVIPAVAARYGGPSRAIFPMCRALRQREIDTVIATTDADGDGHLAVEREALVRYDDVPTIFFRRQWSEAVKYSRPLSVWLERNVRDFAVVHVHAVFSHSSLAAARACRRSGVPYVVRPLGSLDPWSLGRKRVRKRLLWHLAAAGMLRHAAAVHYTTDAERRLAESVVRAGSGVVIPLAVDEELLNPRAHEDTAPSSPYVLVLSRLHPKKGLEVLIAAFVELIARQELPGWRLLVAGDGEPRYVDELKRLAARAGDGRVIFTGWLNGERRTAALQHAAVVALPSYQENFGLSVIEAMACAVPVLVSPSVNLADEIQAAGAGWIVPLDRPALVQGLREALGSHADRVARGAAGRALVRRRFRWPLVADALGSLYRGLDRQPTTALRV